MPKLLNPTEAAEFLRCSLPQIYAHSSSGRLPKYKIGSRLFFSESDLEDYIESCRVESRKPIDL